MLQGHCPEECDRKISKPQTPSSWCHDTETRKGPLQMRATRVDFREKSAPSEAGKARSGQLPCLILRVQARYCARNIPEHVPEIHSAQLHVSFRRALRPATRHQI